MFEPRPFFILNQRYLFNVQFVGIQKYRRAFLEFLFALGGEELASAALRQFGIHLGMAFKIVAEACRNIVALRNNVNAFGNVLVNFVKQKRVVGAAQNYGVYLGVATHQIVYASLYEIVCAVAVVFVVLYKRNPHWARLARNLHVGVQFLNLQLIGM